MIRSIVEQHALEAAFLWMLRDAGANGPKWTLGALADFDERIEAHLDGLRIAGDVGWEVCEEVLPLEDAGEAFVVAAQAIHLEADDRLAALLDRIGGIEGGERALVSAMGFTTLERLQPTLEALLDPEAPPALGRLGVAGAVAHRAPLGPVLAQAVHSTDPKLRARALRAVGELGRVDLKPYLHAVLADEMADEEARFFARWSLALLGDRQVADALLAAMEGPFAARAVEIAPRIAPSSKALAALERLSDARLAILGVGALGDPAGLSLLCRSLHAPELARIAAQAIATITGIDAQHPRYTAPPPPDAPASPNDDPSDERVEMDPDEHLPWPNPDALEVAARSLGLREGHRYIGGEPVASASVSRMLRVGTQAQRRGAAIEQCLLSPGAPLVEVRAPGFSQQRAS